eukprot:4056983-Prymnesium_polylepis.1
MPARCRPASRSRGRSRAWWKARAGRIVERRRADSTRRLDGGRLAWRAFRQFERRAELSSMDARALSARIASRRGAAVLLGGKGASWPHRRHCVESVHRGGSVGGAMATFLVE